MSNNNGSLKKKAIESFYDSYDGISESFSYDAFEVALRQVMKEVHMAGYLQGVRHGPLPIILLDANEKEPQNI